MRSARLRLPEWLRKAQAVQVRRPESGVRRSRHKTGSRLRCLHRIYNKDVPLNFKVQQGRAACKKGSQTLLRTGLDARRSVGTLDANFSDVALLASSVHVNQGESGPVTGRFYGHQVLIILCPHFQFDDIAGVVAVALDLS